MAGLRRRPAMVLLCLGANNVQDAKNPETWNQLLARAAALAVERDLDVDAFMRGAWSAYVEARPGYREYLEEQALETQIEAMRQAGHVGQA